MTKSLNKHMSDEKATYAVGCSFQDDNDLDGYGEVFFVRFQTKNEKEAIRLAQCVCGEAAIKSLVILTVDGEIYPID